ncbi:MAG: hypothetical protein EBZ49_00410 [Proteobacteria bacterium]|nr:hypothetical protein [Pseudomonadota bacterium]
MRNLEQLLADADAIIEKRASVNQPETQNTETDEDIAKLANYLLAGEEKTTESQEETIFEKAAHAVAIVETIQNIEQIKKLAEFEKRALEAGHPQEEVDAYIDKLALTIPTKYVAGLTALGGAGALGAHAGKKRGYNKALKDINTALEAYESQPE